MEQQHVCSISPTEFEKYCLEILTGFAEEEHLPNFSITHNIKIPAADGTYQIDVYAIFTAMGVEFKVLCECKQYSSPVTREKVVILSDKLKSLGAHKGILLSTSGFQSGAIQYAKAHGISLIRVEDYHLEYLTHSSNPKTNADNDPFLYAERNMPPYIAFDYTKGIEAPLQVYPTKRFVKTLLIEQNRRLNEAWGLNLQLDFSE